MSCHQELLARARALRPILAERAEHTSELRRVPEESIAAFQEAGFFRMLQPKRWGGYEVHPNTFFDVQREVAAGCASSGWVLGVVAIHAWQLALFPEQAQEDVWGSDASTLISSSYAPTGKVEKVEGGYRISGRWSFSSGSDHCQWIFLGGFAPTPEGSPPDMRTFLLPRSDYEIDDNWHTFALRGTGSKDIVVEGAFVPEHRTHKLIDGYLCKSPGNALNTAPLYRIPFGQIFVRSVSTSALGIARAALDFYLGVTAKKVGAADGSPAAKDPGTQLSVARAASKLDKSILVLHRNFDELMAYAERGEVAPIDKRVAWRWDSSEVVSDCVEVVDALFANCGGRALFTSSPIHRLFCDVHGARAHFANRPEKSGRNYGAVQLGLRSTDFFI
ncbi:MAG: flavin-dependent monooxygenase [Proteobacteria bacterium]|nr:flavin-dependent monooxygenase [Pseudomonadota bacterium]MCP4922096.1 flavin-dependent monooxygenase [Pseudomonadota bacterium]